MYSSMPTSALGSVLLTTLRIISISPVPSGSRKIDCTLIVNFSNSMSTGSRVRMRVSPSSENVA